jgi:hypothetical protein
VELDRNIKKRADAFKRQHRELERAFEHAHQQLGDVAAHRDLKHLELAVGDVENGSFELRFAGSTMVVRLVPEMTDGGGAAGKLVFLEKSGRRSLDDTCVGSIRFQPGGLTEVLNENGEKVDLSYNLFEISLLMFEKLFRERATG